MADSAQRRRALVVADGDVTADALAADGAANRSAEATAAGRAAWSLVVAADGGALKAEALGLRPDLVVGDLDSLAPERVEALRSAGVAVEAHPSDKDASDTELAVRAAVERGSTEVRIVGALGGHRLEHSLANVLMLSLPELAGRDVSIVDGEATVRVLVGPAKLVLDGRARDFVSLLPLSDHVDGVRTAGLVFPLRDERLDRGPTRGLSNVMEDGHASVAIGAGCLVVVHTRVRDGDEIDG